MEILFTEKEVKIIEKLLKKIRNREKIKPPFPKYLKELFDILDENDRLKLKVEELNKKLLIKKMEIDSIFDLTSASYWSFDKKVLVTLVRNLIMGQLGVNKLIIFSKNKKLIEILEKRGVYLKEEKIKELISQKVKDCKNNILPIDDSFLPNFTKLYFISSKENQNGIGVLIGNKIGGIEITPEEEDFVQTILMQLNIMLDNIELYHSHLEKVRIRKELSIAKKIQDRMLPYKNPEWEGIKVEALTLTSYEVGGDLYDFLEDKKNYYVTIGDVSGKGISAALIMASAQASVRSLLKGGRKDLKSIIKRLNKVLLSITRSEMYLTFIIFKIDKKGEFIEYFNAGHLPALLFKKDGRILELNEGSYFLGMFEKIDGKNGKIRVEKNDKILLFTDGLSEFEKDSKEIGVKGIKEYFKKSDYDIKKMYELLTGGQKIKLKDDLTIISLNF